MVAGIDVGVYSDEIDITEGSEPVGPRLIRGGYGAPKQSQTRFRSISAATVLRHPPTLSHACWFLLARRFHSQSHSTKAETAAMESSLKQRLQP
ncbi:hypothetical protein WN944_001386 [Citrus x changshan-huyou]|uniref:Uncharacterized protein n=1 Tax=Citrus x changshan-huyou TaxID=2935761 RepID=A0AAP0MEK1_9ROSI